MKRFVKKTVTASTQSPAHVFYTRIYNLIVGATRPRPRDGEGASHHGISSTCRRTSEGWIFPHHLKSGRFLRSFTILSRKNTDGDNLSQHTTCCEEVRSDYEKASKLESGQTIIKLLCLNRNLWIKVKTFIMINVDLI